MSYIDKPIFEEYGADCFLKVKNDYFDIGIVLFTFGRFDIVTKELKKNIDCCLTFGESLVLCEDLKTIIPAKLRNIKKEECAWESRLGGVNEEKAQEQGLRDDGYAVSRRFKIQSAEHGYCRFTAIQCAGRTDDRGLIIPQPKISGGFYITVPISTEEKFRQLACMVELSLYSYSAGMYGSFWPQRQKQFSVLHKEKDRSKQSVLNTAPEESCSKQCETSVSRETVIADCWYSAAKGSTMETRGKKGEAVVLKLVTNVIKPDDPGILPTSPDYQLIDAVFYEKALERAGFSESFQVIKERINAGYDGNGVPNLKGLVFKIGDIRDGYRQLIFQRLSSQ